MEVMAEDFLNEIVDRNMVQVVRTSASKRVKQCRMHDVLRDLSIFKAKVEIFIEIHGNIDFQPSIKSRHHVIHSNIDRNFASKPSIPRLHSLLFYDLKHWMQCHLDFICENFKLLRVLDLEYMQIYNLQREIGKLIHLRYLGLKNTRTSKLPTSMRYLKSLQTLDISNVLLAEIPDIICKMRDLRHLYMNTSEFTGKLRIDTLKNLQTLTLFHINNLELKNIGKLLHLRKLGVEM
ncbi:hypothetical protein Ddye_013752 [Dipteronia dyeriana]|uniref:Uncharacterized protein n=1 Tax=Dipteronia dyeriana TaxID=168575 RepID=A0AAD9X6P5_9ROSI|nr:hypothetical protein Ddye_013752 [Dipteronia dyeriana]